MVNDSRSHVNDTGTLRAPNECVVEGNKVSMGWSATQMHRTRKLNPVGRERQSRCHGRFNFHVYVLEAQPVGHCIADHILLESVQNAKDPSGFKQYCFRDPDWPGCKQGLCGSTLFGVVR